MIGFGWDFVLACKISICSVDPIDCRGTDTSSVFCCSSFFLFLGLLIDVCFSTRLVSGSIISRNWVFCCYSFRCFLALSML